MLSKAVCNHSELMPFVKHNEKLSLKLFQSITGMNFYKSQVRDLKKVKSKEPDSVPDSPC